MELFQVTLEDIGNIFGALFIALAVAAFIQNVHDTAKRGEEQSSK